jgi:putative endonuclease
LSQSDKYPFYVYILRNSCGKFYVGQTSDLEKRVASHNGEEKIKGRYTHKNGQWELVWSEGHPTRASAMAREKQIKKMKSARWITEHLLGQNDVSGR